MDYKVLKTLYYKNREEYERECVERPKSMAATGLSLDIHGKPAYYMNCPELTMLIADCYEKAKVLQSRIAVLPGLAHSFYRVSIMIDEVMLSNDLEGVHSTRKEIRDIIDADPKKEDTQARLYGMVRKYARLLDADNEIDLSGSASIRQLYDELVSSEIAKDDLPDGEYFRKGPVSIVTATEKEKHKGVNPPESNIIGYMEKALSLLHNDGIPTLIQIALFHYFIGYIHPFYDGNGRLSRFISSYLLKRNLDELVALRLSYAIKERKSKYYDAFDVVNDPKNMGDTTPFVLAFLKIILAAEDSLIKKIEGGMDRYHYYGSIISVLYAELADENMMQILFVLIQNALFGAEPLGIDRLADAVKMSKGKTRAKLKKLIEKTGDQVIKTSKDGHRYIYAVDLDELEKLCKSFNEKDND